MQKPARALLLATLLVLAGCSGTVQETTTTTPPEATSPTPTETTTTTTTSSTTTTTTVPTTTPAPDNPWAADTVSVAVLNRANQSREFTPLVNQTIAYWNENASQYGDYTVNFTRTTNTYTADIVVDIVTQIVSCSDDDPETVIGCAPTLDKYSTAATQEHVQIVAGYSNESTARILKHEFGHVLGIEHGEDPMPTMKALSEYTHLSQPDIHDRPVPWQSDTLSVYINMDNFTYRQTAREQVEHALEYYADGADGAVPENVSFEVVEEKSTADIVIVSPTGIDCGTHREVDGTCGQPWGYDTDTDDNWEYYDRLEIQIAHQTDVDLVGWYVGSWLTDAFGLRDGEVPPPFEDPDYDTASGEWWE